MKNRKFIGRHLECIGWDIQTYTSKIFEGEPMFYAEFTFSNGNQLVNFDLNEARKMAEELTKFIKEASIKEHEFNEKHKKKAKK